MRIGYRTLEPGSRPYVIAEIGVNHGGSFELAKRLIELAKDGGADAAKFQSYKAASLASRNSPAYWDTTKEPTLSQRELFAKYDLFGPDEYVALAEHCGHVGIDFLSTPFDDQAIEFLEPLVPVFKIASADLTNVPFLRKVARTGKPIVLSTGASTLAEISRAVSTLRAAGCHQLALLHCVLNYPTPNFNAHIRMIEGLKRSFPDLQVGYSDHTLPDDAMTALVLATALGAVILEKHFTHDKALPGNDHYHAMDVNDLRRLGVLLDRTLELMGTEIEKTAIASEAPARQHARRSVVSAAALPAGAVLAETDLTTKRPAHGIAASEWDSVIGRRLRHAIPDDHVLQWSDLE